MKEETNRKMDISKYDVVWKTPGGNSARSMPCGGFDAGAAVWVENGEILFYLDRSGSFDENNQMLKLGRFRFRFIPSVLEEEFEQALRLEEGRCVISGKGVRITIWFDVYAPACHVEVESEGNIMVQASYESWRTKPRELKEQDRHAAASYVTWPGEVTTWPDTVKAQEDGILFFHRNRSDRLLFDFLMEQQGLKKVAGEMYNPQKNRTFGGRLTGKGCHFSGVDNGSYAGVPYQSFILLSEEKKRHSFLITMHTSQESLQKWMEGLEKEEENQRLHIEKIRENAILWWKAFWKRSFIFVNPDRDQRDAGWRVGRNYQLFRYMLACNARGDYPTKFNGGLFTMDPCYSVPEDGRGETPDFRAWGGGSFTAQNQRLVYWGMLKNGDFDMMHAQFRYYSRLLKNACLRTQVYWGHEGCSFTEQLENIGIPIGWAWGYPDISDPDHCRPENFDPTEVRTPWLQYYYSSQLEFSWMILQFYRYTGEDIGEYIPFIEESVAFYDAHYRMLHYQRCRQEYRDGKLVIAPSTALENYKGAVNPMDAVAGLRAVVEELTKLPEYVDVEKYRELMEHLPDIPTGFSDGKEIFLPAESWLHKMGDELPQLYTVFPYEFCHLGKKKEQGRNTWELAEGWERNYFSWRQGGIFTARLGLTEEAKDYCLKKLDDGPLRFPAFWGPGHDWTPDHNWGGSGMIGMQEMLVQQHDDTIYLFPAWPKEWDVTFRLHLPESRILEGCLKEGKAEYRIFPEDQRKETIRIINCLDQSQG